MVAFPLLVSELLPFDCLFMLILYKWFRYDDKAYVKQIITTVCISVYFCFSGFLQDCPFPSFREGYPTVSRGARVQKYQK